LAPTDIIDRSAASGGEYLATLAAGQGRFRTKGGTMRGIYRCTDGHLFQRSFKQMLFEANLGPGKHVTKCPFDGKRSVITRVPRNELTPQQIAEVEAETRAREGKS
jgi:hypothetical protein